MERKNVNVLIALDLSAAFDMVDHGILLSTLNYNFSIDGTVLEWVRNYLAPREIKIKLANITHKKKN